MAFDLLAAVLADLDLGIGEADSTLNMVARGPTAIVSAAARNSHGLSLVTPNDQMTGARAASGSVPDTNICIGAATESTTIRTNSEYYREVGACPFNQILPLPQEWIDGVIRLKKMRLPPGTAPDDWDEMLFALDVISERWLGQAAALGWTTTDIFGGKRRPAALAFTGGLLVEVAEHKGDILAMTTDEAILRSRDGKRARYLRRCALPQDMAPMWDIHR